MADQVMCGEKHKTPQPARMAFRITRPTRGNIKVTIYTDEREAPKSASAVCKRHGKELLNSFLEVLVDGDDPEGGKLPGEVQ